MVRGAGLFFIVFLFVCWGFFENFCFYQKGYILIHHFMLCDYSVFLSVLRTLKLYWLSHKTLA